MNITRINQFEPYFDKDDSEEVARIIQSGWVQEGKKTREFEKQFADFVGTRFAVATTSGTIAISLAAFASGLRTGDEVLVPDYTAIGTLNGIGLTGARPILVDVRRSDCNIDPDEIEKYITPRTRAIVPVHINGRAADMKSISEISEKYNLAVIEDAAQCLGSRINGKHLGALSKVGCFSLATSKVITTGQGGMVVTDDESIFTRLVQFKDQGTTARLSSTTIPDWYESTGFNFKFTDVQAALGISQMRKLEQRIQHIKHIFNLYQELLQGREVTFLETNMKSGLVPWYVDCIVNDSSNRTRIIESCKKDAIGTRISYRPLHTQPAYRTDGYFDDAIYLYEHGIWFPSSSFLTDEDIKRVCDVIRHSLEH